MEKLGVYQLTGHLSSQNSGYSVWGFGRKNGRDYFIKQFLSPKYPENDTVSSPERLAKIKKKCQSFEQKKMAIYQMINQHSDGNAVRVEEFFRVESKYYISMRKIDALPWTVEDIARLKLNEKSFLCSVIAHGIAGLHAGRVVHADLKHDNILFMQTGSGCVTAKIIDFDSGFLETDPPKEGEEIIGDQVYFSPEACKTFMGENPELTCKMDIFALGILFHQYFSGALPEYDTELGCFAGEVVARGGSLTVAENMPTEIRELLIQMLDPEPENRPTAMEVYSRLSGRQFTEVVPDPIPQPVEEVYQLTSVPAGGNPFFRPGDL